MAKTCVDKKMLAVKHCVSKDEWRHSLNFVKVNREHAVATNGRVLVAIKNTLTLPEGEDGDFLLDADMVKFAEQMLRSKKNPPVELEECDGQMKMKGQTQMMCQATVSVDVDETKFPKTDQAIPSDTKKLASISVELLEKVLKSAKAAGLKSLEMRQEENTTGPLLFVGDEGNFQAVLMPRRDG